MLKSWLSLNYELYLLLTGESALTCFTSDISPCFKEVTVYVRPRLLLPFAPDLAGEYLLYFMMAGGENWLLITFVGVSSPRLSSGETWSADLVFSALQSRDLLRPSEVFWKIANLPVFPLPLALPLGVILPSFFIFLIYFKLC